MSDKDFWDEMVEISHSLKGYLEREQAAGRGDLLASGARAAAGSFDLTKANSIDSAPRAEVPAAAESTKEPAAEPARMSEKEAWAEAVAITQPAEEQDMFAPAPARRRPTAVATSIELNPAGPDARSTVHDSALPVLTEVAAQVNGCTQCGLCETRTKAVPGHGSARSGIVFVGEAPGAEEDRQGKPFVGRSGDLLTRIIKAMDDAQLIPGVPLDRDTVFICNVLKCRPPENRNPLPHEIETCSPYLKRQLEALKPRVIVCLGKFAAELLVGVKGTIAGLRGKAYRYQGAKLIVTYHPAACLRNPNYKRPVWDDMQFMAREYLSP